MNGHRRLEGTHYELTGAYHELAEKIVRREARARGITGGPGTWSPRQRAQLERHFEDMGQIETRVSIKVQPHNQWVRDFVVEEV
jgi:D-mannonate dehydratase